MISMIVFGSLVTSLAIISVMAKASPIFLKRVLGYEAYVDLVFSLLIGFACGISGTMSGFVIGAATGLIFGCTLFVLSKMYGYQKFEDGKWIDYPAKWTLKALKDKASTEGKSAIQEKLSCFNNPKMGSLA